MCYPFQYAKSILPKCPAPSFNIQVYVAESGDDFASPTPSPVYIHYHK